MSSYGGPRLLPTFQLYTSTSYNSSLAERLTKTFDIWKILSSAAVKVGYVPAFVYSILVVKADCAVKLSIEGLILSFTKTS